MEKKIKKQKQNTRPAAAEETAAEATTILTTAMFAMLS